MAHAHGHDHHHHGGHPHVHAADATGTRLKAALGLIAGFIVLEIVVGLVANSLALLSDAAHMTTDAAALTLSLVALRLAARPAAGMMTYGLKRAEILSALANGVTLLVLAVLIVYEGIRRLITPADVDAQLMLVVGIAGTLLNVAAIWVLHGADRTSLNIEGSFQHMLTDLLASLGAVAAAAVILATGWDAADPVASLLVAASMLRAAYRLIRDSTRVFLEAAPRGYPPDEIGRTMAAQPGVVEVHDLHVWELTSGFPVLTAHVMVEPNADCHGIRRELDRMLGSRYGIDHTTLQVGHATANVVQLTRRPERR
jgi:cobalt-zinc-cadmium efflux system protein